MVLSDDYQKYSKEELSKELQELYLKHEQLKDSHEKDFAIWKTRDIELKKGEEKFKKAFVTSPDSVNINRMEDGMYISINKGFTKITGYNEDEVIGRTSIDLNIWADPADRDKLVKGLREKGEVENLETRFLMKNGSVRSGIMSASLIDLDGIPHILSITRDITDSKYAEIALQESENRYRELIELAVDGILLGSSDGTIIGANSYMVTLTGMSLDQILGMHVSGLFSSDSLNKKPLRFDLLQKGETIINDRYVLRPDGNTIPVEMHTKMMPDGTYQSICRDISIRLENERALRESERLLRESQNVARLGSFVWNIPTGIWKSSKILDEIFGIGEEHVRTFESWSEIVHPDWRETMIRYVKNDILVNHLKFDKKYPIIRQNDGQKRWVHGISELEFDIENQPINLIGTIIDITDRHEAEESLKLSEEKFRSIAENLSDVIFITDSKGIMQYVSPSCRVFGYTPEECAGRFFGDFLADGEIGKALPVFANLLFTESRNATYSFLIKRKDGSTFFAELSGSVFLVGDKIRGILGLLRDVSEKMNREIELRKLSRAVEQNPASIIITDTEGTIEYINPKVCEITGYSKDELIGKNPRLLNTGDQSKVDYKALWNTIKSGNEWKGEFHNRKKNGDLYWESASISPIKNDNGDITHFVGIKEDISQRILAGEQMKLAKEKAEASDKMKTTFLNNISHEVRTPLNGILGFAEIITHPDLSDEDKNESVSMLYQSTDRLLKTITNYMDISLLTSGSMSVNMKDFSPAHTLRNIYENSRSICSARNLKLNLDIPEENTNILINSDKEIISKIICHFLDNAVKFSENGSIGMGYQITGTNVVFFVKDTGIGIGRESLNMIFEKFAKEERETVKISEGSGLGLSIAKGMSELIGGSVNVESEPGKGSCFSLSLTLSSVRRVLKGDKPGDSKITDQSGTEVLIAEDDETNFFYLKAILSREMSVRIIHARNGQEAIEYFRAGKEVKLVLMDIKMPDIDGLEATRQIKMMNPEVPVIAITAYAMSGDEERVLASGCDGYLSKPISQEKLLRKIAEFVDIR